MSESVVRCETGEMHPDSKRCVDCLEAEVKELEEERNTYKALFIKEQRLRKSIAAMTKEEIIEQPIMVECPHCGKTVQFYKGEINICVAPDLIVDVSQ